MMKQLIRNAMVREHAQVESAHAIALVVVEGGTLAVRVNVSD